MKMTFSKIRPKVGLLFLILFVSSLSTTNGCPFDTNNLIQNYKTIIECVQNRQKEFQTKFTKTRDIEEKKIIIAEASSYIFKVLTTKIFPGWYGTPWSFTGQTRTPKKGSIACGYFVVFCLQDVGFKIPSKMAKQPSENIIKNLINASKIKRFWNAAKMDKIKKWIEERGEGLFVIGLDIHVGFIINHKGNITFCHSSYYSPPEKVINQYLWEEGPLADSTYRVIGKILDDNMIKNWILGKSFPIKYDYFNQ
jgi:hypothetical protein